MTAIPDPKAFNLPEPWRQLVDLGFSVFPVERGGKNPSCKWKPYQTVRADRATVSRWAGRESNIGIATGAVSGLIVLDLDSAEAVAEAQSLGIPHTITVRTGKGLHVYFQHPGGTIGNRAGVRPGWDIRGDGGYVVAPGSLHPSGVEYTWDNPPGFFDLAPMPDWLVVMLAKPDRQASKAQPAPSSALDTPYGLKALDGEVQAILRAGNGEQEKTLNAAALKMGALVAGDELSLASAKNRLIAAGLSMASYDAGNTWTVDDIASKVERGLADGARKPRSAPERAPHNVVYPYAPEWMNEAPGYEDYDTDTGEIFSDDLREELMPTLDLAALATVKPQAKRFAIERLAPLAEVTLFTGPGSGGKSLLAQQLATAAAAGLSCLGLDVMTGPAIYLTCEDDAEQLHFRQAHICEALGVPMASLAGKLHLVSLRGGLDNELGTFAADGKLSLAPAYHRIARMIEATGAKLVFLDNVAHLFTGNENDRGNVTRFINLLNRLAGDTGAAILLLGHPNKSGDSYSGSTAWLNAVRSQITIDHDKDGDGNVLDLDARVLTVGKANYARKGEALTFRWHNWAFVRDEDLPADTRAELSEVIKANGENAAFMRCLEAATKNKRAVSHNPGVNYAPTVFAKMPEGKGLGRNAYERAFERLLHLGEIELDAPLWQDNHRHWKQGIRAVEKCGNPPAATPCGDLRAPHSQVIEKACGVPRAATPLYTTYIPGAAQWAAAPGDDLAWGTGGEGEE